MWEKPQCVKQGNEELCLIIDVFIVKRTTQVSNNFLFHLKRKFHSCQFVKNQVYIKGGSLTLL